MSVAMRSSALLGYIEYVPGRSVRMAFSVLVSSKSPVFRSTVVPAKLEVFCFNPVKALKSVDFPQLGLPAIAICR